MFQNNYWCGLLFLCGIFYGAYSEGQGLVAWGALIGLITSTITGKVLNLPKDDGQQGLWGFNGILVGCALPTFLGNTILMWIALILCAMMTTWVRTGLNNVMAPWKVNSLTFPFVFSTWIFLLCARAMNALPPQYLSAPGIETVSSGLTLNFTDLVIYWLKGIAQVFLINSWVTGILFLVGLYISNKWAAIWAAIGSALSLLIAILFQASGASIADGLYGFSAVLTGIAIGMTFYKPNIKTSIWAIIGIVITVFIQAGMNVLLAPLGIPTLTAPFCIATWLFLLPLFKFTDNNPNHSFWK